jgi:ketosteroid isomerase-like protein
MKPSRLLVLAGVLFSTAAAQTQPSVAARLQRLEDIEAIRTVLLNYGRFLDARDFAAYSRLFAKDGEWAGGFGTVKGPAEIQAFMEKQIPGPNKGNTYHILSNFEIDVHGDTARAWSRWAYITPGTDSEPVIAQGGRYDDILVRENGAWKFKRRVASNDIPNAGPANTK